MAAQQHKQQQPQQQLLQRQSSSSPSAAEPMDQDANNTSHGSDNSDMQPLDMSVKRHRSDSPPPPPPYKYTPLRRCSPPPRLEQPQQQHQQPHHPHPHYLPPPPYPCSSSPSPPAAAAAALPPPPSYESSTRGKKVVLAPDSTTPAIGSSKPDSPQARTTMIREITIITADTSADPLLDEHFRRSLGANYKNLFKKDSSSSSSHSPLMSSSPKRDPMEQERKRIKTEPPEMPGLAPVAVPVAVPAAAIAGASRSNKPKDPVREFQEDMEGYTGERESETCPFIAIHSPFALHSTIDPQ